MLLVYNNSSAASLSNRHPRSPSTEPRNSIMRARRPSSIGARDVKRKGQEVQVTTNNERRHTHLFCYLYAFDSSGTVHLTSSSSSVFFKSVHRSRGENETHRDVQTLAMIDTNKIRAVSSLSQCRYRILNKEREQIFSLIK